MNAASLRKLLIGLVIGLAISSGVTAGLFDEASQSEQSSTAWCGDACK